MQTATWREKAHRVIGQLAHAAYEKANRLPNGRLRKRHVPYALPEVARALVECLGTDDEARAKGIFLYDYDVQKLG